MGTTNTIRQGRRRDDGPDAPARIADRSGPLPLRSAIVKAKATTEQVRRWKFAAEREGIAWAAFIRLAVADRADRTLRREQPLFPDHIPQPPAPPPAPPA